MVVSTCLAPLTSGVSPEARVYVNGLEITDAAARITLGPVSKAPEGDVTVWVRLTLEGHNGTGQSRVWDERVTAHLPPPSARSPYSVVGNATFLINPGPGMYRVRGAVLSDNGGAGQLWHERTQLLRVGSGPSLADGWGEARWSAVSDADLTGDGTPDAFFSNASSGEPVPWSLVAAANPWESPTGTGWTLNLAFWSTTEAHTPVRLRLGEAAVRRILHAGPGDEIQGYNQAPMRFGLDGNLTLDFAAIPSASTQAHQVYLTTYFLRPFSEDIATIGWFDGYRTHVNLTRTDLNGDGERDFRFWKSRASTTSEARNQSEADRRVSPDCMSGGVVVSDTLEGREVDLAVSRCGVGAEGGDHGPAWLELRLSEEALRRALSSNRTDPNANLVLRLSLSPEDGFVEPWENTIWVWFGHFSVQHVWIVVPYTARQVPWANADGDEVRNDQDACPGRDDAVDADRDGVPDGCEAEGDPDPWGYPIPPVGDGGMLSERETNAPLPVSSPGMALLLLGVGLALAGWRRAGRQGPQ